MSSTAESMDECKTPCSGNGETKESSEKQPPELRRNTGNNIDRPVYVALDIEKAGEGKKYPILAVGFAAVDACGKPLYGSTFYLPELVTCDTFEPFCAENFWYDRTKVPQKVFDAMKEGCAKSFKHYATKTNSSDARILFESAWKDIAREIDHIYELFGTNTIADPIWVGDCLDFDYGYVNQALLEYADRLPVRFNGIKERHWIEDCGAGKDALKKLCPEKYARFKALREATGAKKTHNPGDDALYIATEYAIYCSVLKDAYDTYRQPPTFKWERKYGVENCEACGNRGEIVEINQLAPGIRQEIARPCKDCMVEVLV